MARPRSPHRLTISREGRLEAFPNDVDEYDRLVGKMHLHRAALECRHSGHSNSNIRHETRRASRPRESVIYLPARAVFRVPFISSFTVLRHDLRGIRMRSDAVAFCSSSLAPVAARPTPRRPPLFRERVPLVIFSLPVGGWKGNATGQTPREREREGTRDARQRARGPREKGRMPLTRPLMATSTAEARDFR